MPLTSEEIRLAKQAKAAQRLAAIEAVASAFTDRGPDNLSLMETAAVGLHDALLSIAGALRAEAISLEGAKLKGVKSIQTELRTAAKSLEGFASGLIAEATAPSTAGHDAAMAFIGGETDEYDPPALSPATESFLTGEDAFVGATQGDASEPVEVPSIEGGGATVPALTITAAPTAAFPNPTPPLILPPLVEPVGAPKVERMSWEDFNRLGEAKAIERANTPVSPSTIGDLAECGAKWLFGHSHLKDVAGRDLEPPAWWNAGGTAFHRVVETIERAANPPTDPNDITAGFIWSRMFDEERKRLAAESGWPESAFRTAAKGLENYDWWRVNGEAMVRKYIAYHTREWRARYQVAKLVDGTTLLEQRLSRQYDIGAMHGDLDAVYLDMTTGQLTIVDYKSGGHQPFTTFQLGAYRSLLATQLSPTVGPIRGAFWNARAGSHDMEVPDLAAKHPDAEVAYRVAAATTVVRAGAFMPRPSRMAGGCFSCAFNKLCPAVDL